MKPRIAGARWAMWREFGGAAGLRDKTRIVLVQMVLVQMVLVRQAGFSITVT